MKRELTGWLRLAPSSEQRAVIARMMCFSTEDTFAVGSETRGVVDVEEMVFAGIA